MREQPLPRRSSSALGLDLVLFRHFRNAGRLVLLTSAVAIGLPSSRLPAQQPDLPPADAPASVDPVATEAEPTATEAEQLGLIDPSAVGEWSVEERFEDPLAKALLGNTYPELYTQAQALGAGADRQVEAMARGDQQVDRNLLAAYIQYQVAQLTNHKNLDSMLDATANSAGARAVEQAGQRLAQPYVVARQAQNSEFRDVYTGLLIQAAPELLKSQFYVRLMGLFALSRSGDHKLVPLFASVLKDPSQPLAVKLMAIIGLSTVAEDGRLEVPPALVLEGVRALRGFLVNNPSLFWPIEYRAMQTLGALRLAGTDPLRPEADVAATIMSYLVDPARSNLARSQAAWALGMLAFSGQLSRFNFELVAYHIAWAATAVGDDILEVDASNPAVSEVLVRQLVQLVFAFDGRQEMRNSGLLQTEHPSMSGQRQAVEAYRTQVRDVTQAAVELIRAAGVQRSEYRDRLKERVEALKQSLRDSPPSDLELYPNGPTFPPPAEPSTAPADGEPTGPADGEPPPPPGT